MAWRRQPNSHNNGCWLVYLTEFPVSSLSSILNLSHIATALGPSAAPSNVRATSTSSTITVQWEMVPCIHRNGEITGYSVRYGVQGQSTQTTTVSGGDTTMTTIEGVMSSTTYSIEAAAVNSVDTGPYSETVMIETPQSKWAWNNIFVVDHNTD